MTYKEKRDQARNEAVKWQADFMNHNYSYAELLYYCDYFEKVGRKYDLLEEFHENGIL